MRLGLLLCRNAGLFGLAGAPAALTPVAAAAATLAPAAAAAVAQPAAAAVAEVAPGGLPARQAFLQQPGGLRLRIVVRHGLVLLRLQHRDQRCRSLGRSPDLQVRVLAVGVLGLAGRAQVEVVPHGALVAHAHNRVAPTGVARHVGVHDGQVLGGGGLLHRRVAPLLRGLGLGGRRGRLLPRERGRGLLGGGGGLLGGPDGVLAGHLRARHRVLLDRLHRGRRGHGDDFGDRRGHLGKGRRGGGGGGGFGGGLRLGGLFRLGCGGEHFNAQRLHAVLLAHADGLQKLIAGGDRNEITVFIFINDGVVAWQSKSIL
mmetsp:Transcript_90744/g.207612  ORF Transcript_90744/g.207612 Transcript_90744/m.207612 type:complete len:315 (-) Transcript_90744:194-1138(-)